MTDNTRDYRQFDHARIARETTYNNMDVWQSMMARSEGELKLITQDTTEPMWRREAAMFALEFRERVQRGSRS